MSEKIIKFGRSGSIRLYLGCMYSGKTSELIREYTRYQKIGKKVICINYALDNRYDTTDTDNNNSYVYSHDLNKIKCLKSKTLKEINYKTILEYDVILINEGQFFPDILEFCTLYCDKHNKNIIVCGLDGDYLRKPFGEINQLISIADEITKLKALCIKCNDGTPALFTWRMSNDINQVSINNDYIPVCRFHYLENMNNNHNNNNIKQEPEFYNDVNYIT
jgi:thymidine kinase